MKYHLFMAAETLLGSPDALGIPTKEASTGDLSAILNVVYLIAGAIAVLMIVIAGINYATSGGDSGKLTKAKNTIIFAIAGVVIVSSAFIITNFILGGTK